MQNYDDESQNKQPEPVSALAPQDTKRSQKNFNHRIQAFMPDSMPLNNQRQASRDEVLSALPVRWVGANRKASAQTPNSISYTLNDFPGANQRVNQRILKHRPEQNPGFNFQDGLGGRGSIGFSNPEFNQYYAQKLNAVNGDLGTRNVDSSFNTNNYIAGIRGESVANIGALARSGQIGTDQALSLINQAKQGSDYNPGNGDNNLRRELFDIAMTKKGGERRAALKMLGILSTDNKISSELDQRQNLASQRLAQQRNQLQQRRELSNRDYALDVARLNQNKFDTDVNGKAFPSQGPLAEKNYQRELRLQQLNQAREKYKDNPDQLMMINEKARSMGLM